MEISKLFIALLILGLTKIYKNEVVCAEDELIREILEDLADNKKLDCLRESLPNPGETPQEKELRIKAMWDSDCSFESNSDGVSWVTRIQKNYLLFKGLIDVDGKPYEFNKPEQADMCEIIRSFIGNGLFPNAGSEINGINKDFVQFIDCPGDEGSTEVCAATPYSFAEKKGWYIFIDGKGLSISDEPRYVISSN